MRVDSIFTPGALKRLGGARSYERGVRYADSGRVRSLEVAGDSVSATVKGQRLYHVRLWIEGDGPAYSCECPVGGEGRFCKHCVAVGLALSDRHQQPSRLPDTDPSDDLRASLEGLPKETLIDLLVERAQDDDLLLGRLQLLGAQNAGGGPDPAALRAAIENAIITDDFVDYRSMYAYTSNLRWIIDELAALIDGGLADTAVGLCEHTLACLEDALGSVDDSDGALGGIIAEVRELHHAACFAVRSDPAALAKRLFEWELHSDWETFLGAAEVYADVLGGEGLDAYRSLAEKVWAEVPSLGPGDERLHSGRFRITYMMEALERVDGDLDALVAVKSRDLSHAYSYVTIADLYREAGRYDDALEWAEKGLAAFPAGTDVRLRALAADEYQRRGRHDDALALAWRELTEEPTLTSYQMLQRYAVRAERWEQWRAKAIEHLRAEVNRRKRSETLNRWSRADHSVLVEVFVWEKDADAAWAEAQAGGCSEGLWLRLAALRESDHPGDVLPIYRRDIGRSIDAKNNRAYADAVKTMHKLKGLMDRAGRAEEFPTYIASVRTAHKPKRNLMKLMDEAGL